MIYECTECHTGGHEYYIDSMCYSCVEKKLNEYEAKIAELEKCLADIAEHKMNVPLVASQGIQWVSVKDRLPKKTGYILVYYPQSYPHVTHHFHIVPRHDYPLVTSIEFTHWAEINLPEQP